MYVEFLTNKTVAANSGIWVQAGRKLWGEKQQQNAWYCVIPTFAKLIDESQARNACFPMVRGFLKCHLMKAERARHVK